MQSSILVVAAAKDIALVTRSEAKIALVLTSSSDTALDQMIDLLIQWASGEIAVYCNRVLAKETVIETFRELDTYSTRIFLSRWPVEKITSVEADGVVVDSSKYELDATTGKLLSLSGAWGSVVKISYTGGFDVPYKAPPALKQSALLLTRDAYYANIRGDTTIRMVSHKSSRVIYFDPNAKAGAAGNVPGSPTKRAVNDLLRHFMRFEV